MKKIIPVNKNEIYTIEINSLGFQGEGVGKLDNFTIFVEGALEGETVKIKIVKVNKNFAFGKLLNIVKSSEHRINPICSIYNRCGGCQLQQLSYEAQLEFKKNRVKDCLERIGKLRTVSGEDVTGSVSESLGANEVGMSQSYKAAVLHDTIGMENPWRYRNKVQLPVGEYDGNKVIGFYSPRSHNIIDMDICHIQHEVGDKVISIFKDWLKKYNISVYNEETDSGLVRHIMVRKAFNTGEVMVVIVTSNEKLPYKEEIIHKLCSEIEGLKSIIQNINKEKTNIIMGKKCITLWGKTSIVDNIGRFKFDISPLSFFQVNPVQTEVLYNKALEYAALNGSEVVFDAYCGAGTISLFLSQKAKKVYGVEIIPEAIENAKENAAQNGVTNAEFIVGKAEEVIPELISSGVRADVVVVDPPRKGCEKSLLEAIAKMAPDRIVYVSCDPGTLARDLAILNDLGYETVMIQPVDMFPQTAHVETVVKIVKKL